MPATPTPTIAPGGRHRHPCEDHEPGVTALEGVLEDTKVAAGFDMSPADVVTLLVHGIDGPGAAVHVSEGFRTVIGYDPANSQRTAFLIATLAILSAWALLAPGHTS